MKTRQYLLFFLAVSVLPLFFTIQLSQGFNFIKGYELGYLSVFVLTTAVNYMTKKPIYSLALRISYLIFHWFATLLVIRMIGFPIALLYMSYLLRPINAILLLAIPSVFIHGLILKFFIDYESRNANNMLK